MTAPRDLDHLLHCRRSQPTDLSLSPASPASRSRQLGPTIGLDPHQGIAVHGMARADREECHHREDEHCVHRRFTARAVSATA